MYNGISEDYSCVDGTKVAFRSHLFGKLLAVQGSQTARYDYDEDLSDDECLHSPRKVLVIVIAYKILLACP